MDSYNIVLCSKHPAAPGSYLGIRTCSKINGEKKKIPTKTHPTKKLKSWRRFLSLLKQLLLEETLDFLSLVDYVKDYCFPKEWLVSILFANKPVSDVQVTAERGSSQTLEQLGQDCAGHSW